MVLLLSLVLAQTAPASCVKDADCVITTTQCCPGCCGPTPYATSRAADEAEKLRCRTLNCAAPKCSIVCEPPLSPDALEAKCVKQQCVSRMKKAR
jgi:hypothetical protein